MISQIIKNYNNITVTLEVEYTGPELVNYIIDNDNYYVLPYNNTADGDQTYLTLTLPDDFEKMCLIDNSYTIKNFSPSSIEFSNNTVSNLYLNNIGKQLVVEGGELIIVDQPVTQKNTFLSALVNHKTNYVDQLENTTDPELTQQLENLIAELTFVIDSTNNDPDFLYYFYEFQSKFI